MAIVGKSVLINAVGFKFRIKINVAAVANNKSIGLKSGNSNATSTITDDYSFLSLTSISIHATTAHGMISTAVCFLKLYFQHYSLEAKQYDL